MEVLAKASGKAERTDKCFVFQQFIHMSANFYFDTLSLYFLGALVR